jgi:hypothetical protein
MRPLTPSVPALQLPPLTKAGGAPRATSRAQEPVAKAPAATMAERLQVCRACPEKRDIVRGLMLCGKCGCVCQFKAAIQRASCPIGKW